MGSSQLEDFKEQSHVEEESKPSVPLVMFPGQAEGDVLVLSLNILSQKLTDGELPSYSWNYKDEGTRSAHFEERLNALTKFLIEIYRSSAGRLDIINL